MKNDAGDIVRYVRSAESTYCYRNDTLVYGRITGRRRIDDFKGSVTIEPWNAYSGTAPIGLDPEEWYVLFPRAPDKMPIVISDITGGVFIDGVRITDDFVLARVGGKNRAKIRWHVHKPYLGAFNGSGALPPKADEVEMDPPDSLLFVYRPPKVDGGYNKDDILQEVKRQKIESVVLPIHQWQHHIVNHGWITDETEIKHTSIQLSSGNCSWGYRVLPPAGGEEAEVSLEGLIDVPDAPVIVLKGYAGRLFDCPSDGVHLVVRVNGREIWRMLCEDPYPVPISVPLDPYAGKRILLSLAVDAGAKGDNISCDETFWGSMRIEAPFSLGASTQ